MLGDIRLRASPWIALVIGLGFIIFPLGQKHGAVTFGDIYPGISLLIASAVLFWLNWWVNQRIEPLAPPNPFADSPSTVSKQEISVENLPRQSLQHVGVRLYGGITNRPSKTRVAQSLRDAGLNISVGDYAIRVHDCSHFVFRAFTGEFGPPSLDVEADSVEELARDAQLVSRALAAADIAHRFVIIDDDEVEQVEFAHD